MRNALLRLPTTVLVLASLGFLGLGEQPPTAEWGRLLSENQPYAELAPWTVLGPACALVLLSVLALNATGSAAVRSPASVRKSPRSRWKGVRAEEGGSTGQTELRSVAACSAAKRPR